jgi:hypothetical protein
MSFRLLPPSFPQNEQTRGWAVFSTAPPDDFFAMSFLLI